MLLHFEKRGCRKQPDYLINGFRDAVDDCGLREVIMSGYPFTWERSRGCANWVEEKLDRALAYDEWHKVFYTVSVLNEDASLSDHMAILLILNSVGILNV